MAETEIKYIAIEGAIGVGKTSLAKKLREKLDAELIVEQFEANPFLDKFYSDRKRFAFQTQMFFLVNRFKQQEDLNQGNLFTQFVVADYIFEKDRIFAYLNLSGDELKLYETMFPLLYRSLRKPDLVVYLQSNVDRLMYNIKKRNRSFERNISRNYIEELSQAYDHFFFRYSSTPLLIVNSSEIDFVNSEKDFNELFKAMFREDRGFIEYFQPEVKRLL
ncbi:MAG: deoxynucleoside kinase [Ignavibacteriaceae bacterium]|nr:deoxynucleoside kinase [Ignavibacteriaceae bacterium]